MSPAIHCSSLLEKAKNSFTFVFTTISLVAIISLLVTTVMLYQTAMKETANKLTVAASSQAKIIELLSSENTDETLLSEQISNLKAYDGFGNSGEFVIGRRVDLNIEFLTERRHKIPGEIKKIAFDSKFAEPMRLALSGRNGAITGALDYRGTAVFAAYYAIKGRNLGVVAKIDLDEVRAPYIEAFIIAFFLTLITAFFGGYLIYLANKNIIERLSSSRDQISQAFEGTITALSNTLDHRDPYTGNHQKRVSELSEKIALHLGLDEETVKGIRIGALVHDIGKIKVPAEILNRPGKLDSAEMNVIKNHAITGYDIVKNIPFPWPVAEIIIQHHERIDGSGYPYGLKGDQISLPSRIVAVCDVLEAITAYRPYRAGYDLEHAIDFLVQQQDKQFDEQVVQTVLKLYSLGELSYLRENSGQVLFEDGK